MSQDTNLCEKAKVFLENQLHDYEDKIRKLKRKRKSVKVFFVIFVATSIVCSTLCASLVGFAIPPVVPCVLSTTAALCTSLSTRFKLKRKQNELKHTIDQLDKVKRKIDYIVACNGKFSEKDYKQIVGSLR